MARNHYVRRNRLGGLDPLSKYAPMYAPFQLNTDPRTWKTVGSVKARDAEAMVLLGLAEPIEVAGLPWILGYRYTSEMSTAGRSSCALTAHTAYAAAASTTGEFLTPRQRQELRRLEAWNPKG